MRFVLDNDVDVGVRRVLTRAGHECWTVAEVGLAGQVAAVDDEVSVYAEDKGAVLITHDREFTQRRRRQTHGAHIRLACEQPDGPEILRDQLPTILKALEQFGGPCVLVVSREQVKAYAPHWD